MPTLKRYFILAVGFIALSAHAKDLTVKGDRAKVLYNAILALNIGDCGAGSCNAGFDRASCQWSNDSASKYTRCEITEIGGKTHNFSGEKAKKLSDAILASTLVETDCGMGTCGFRRDQYVQCKVTNAPNSNDYRCDLQPAIDANLQSASQDNIDEHNPRINRGKKEKAGLFRSIFGIGSDSNSEAPKNSGR